MIGRAGAALVILLLSDVAILLLSDVAIAEPRSIELYATGDLHGHLEASTFRAHHGHDPAHPTLGGGLALLGGFLKNARTHYPGRVLLVDAGDLFQGTLASNLSEGASMMRGLNQLGYAAAALGNHEFDYGPVGTAPTPQSPKDNPRGALEQRMHEATFPLISANVLGNVIGEKPIAPYVIKEVDGVPVGIIGGTTELLFQTTMRENLAGLTVKPLVTSLLAAAHDAEAHGARVLIAVVHAGAECNRAPRAWTNGETDDLSGCKPNEEVVKLAHALAAVNSLTFSAIVAGHTHQPITMVVDGIPVVESGQNGQYLSHVSIGVDGRGKDAHPTGQFAIERSIEVCPQLDAKEHCSDTHPTHATQYFGQLAPDVDVTKVIADDVAQAKKLADRLLGIELPEGLPTSYGSENALGNFVADVLRDKTHADVGIINGGGIRAALPPGPLHYGALYETFPFENEVVTVPVEGAELQRIVERNLRSQFGALSYAGLRIHAQCENGKVVTQLSIDGKPIDPHGHYKVGTVDFLAHGGDEMLSKPTVPLQTLGTIRAAMESAFTKHGGALRPGELFDGAHRRVELPSARPLRCEAPAK